MTIFPSCVLALVLSNLAINELLSLRLGDQIRT